MQPPITERVIIFYLRVAMAWTFLYPAYRQVLSPDFSVAGFLSHAKTFHDFFSILATPPAAYILSVLVAYGHLLIGLSLLVGLMVRLSAGFGLERMGAHDRESHAVGGDRGDCDLRSHRGQLHSHGAAGRGTGQCSRIGEGGGAGAWGALYDPASRDFSGFAFNGRQG